ncbi:hypothetical protein GGR52DRAFT_245515 [Hypoxylon sp. FL1284]|nr:hypothetical protein GGR52DRAFT_245515 [Hypoxylon sp. FL1284]
MLHTRMRMSCIFLFSTATGGKPVGSVVDVASSTKLSIIEALDRRGLLFRISPLDSWYSCLLRIIYPHMVKRASLSYVSLNDPCCTVALCAPMLKLVVTRLMCRLRPIVRGSTVIFAPQWLRIIVNTVPVRYLPTCEVGTQVIAESAGF